MKKLVQKIADDLYDLDTMVYILNNGFKEIEGYSEQTIKEQLDIYGDCADRINATMKELAEKFGDVKLKDL